MSAHAKDMKPNSLTRELWHIAGLGDVERLKELLRAGVDVNAGDATGVTALMRASYHGQLDMLRALIENGADPNARDGGGLTALSMARHAGHQEIVEALLSLGGETKTKNRSQLRMVDNVPENVPNADDGYDDIPDPTPHVRTLHEPPDIWDLVHTTEPEPDSPPRVKTRSSLTKPLLAAGALIVCVVAAFGWFYFRGGQNDSAPTVEHPNEAVATEPKSTSSQPDIRTERRKEESQRTSPAANDSLKMIPVAKVTSGRAPAGTRVAAAAGLSSGKPASKVQSKTAKSSARLSVEENEGARRPGRSERQTENSASVKKESVKTQPAANPPQTAAPKPKVIQWP